MPDDGGGPNRETLEVPDRFERLRDAGNEALDRIIVPVDESLALLDNRYGEMHSAGRGGLLLVRGESGAGKSTFLDTVKLFREGAETVRIRADEDPGVTLRALGPVSGTVRLVVLEGREALGLGSTESVEAILHAVNAFVRTDDGRDTLVVWPTNTDPLTEMLVEVGTQLGGEALFGLDDPVHRFTGPRASEFPKIAEDTVQTLNDGASLAALGISTEQAEHLASEATTIGTYLGKVSKLLRDNNQTLGGLMPLERYRMWTVVIAGNEGNEPENDVAAVTRGSQSYVDIDRLQSATESNIVRELKEKPARLGLLATSLDARVLNIDMLTALAIARRFGDAQLRELMKAEGMSLSASGSTSAEDRMAASELGRILANNSLGTRKVGSKPGGGTLAAFRSLARIASNNDQAINRAIGEGLKALGLIDSFEVEKDLGTDYTFVSDLYLMKGGEPIRIEVMWRTKVSRAGIANYVLQKLDNYGRAIGY